MATPFQAFDFDDAVAGGIDAPRNSLDETSSTATTKDVDPRNPEDVPLGYEFCNTARWKKREGNDVKRRAPNVVARLMGLDTMPVDDRKPSPKMARRRVRDHPQELELQKFKKEFKENDMKLQLEEKKRKVRATLDKARQALSQGIIAEPKEFLESMEFLQRNKDFIFQFLPEQKGLCTPVKNQATTTERRREGESPRALARLFPPPEESPNVVENAKRRTPISTTSRYMLPASPKVDARKSGARDIVVELKERLQRKEEAQTPRKHKETSKFTLTMSLSTGKRISMMRPDFMDATSDSDTDHAKVTKTKKKPVRKPVPENLSPRLRRSVSDPNLSRCRSETLTRVAKNAHTTPKVASPVRSDDERKQELVSVARKNGSSPKLPNPSRSPRKYGQNPNSNVKVRRNILDATTDKKLPDSPVEFKDITNDLQERRHQSRRQQHRSNPAPDFAFVRNVLDNQEAIPDKKIPDKFKDFDLQERRQQQQLRSNPAANIAFVRKVLDNLDATIDKKVPDSPVKFKDIANDLQERRHQSRTQKHCSNPAPDFAFVRNVLDNQKATTDKKLSDKFKDITNDLQEKRHQSRRQQLHRTNPASDFAFVRNNEDATTDKKLSDDLQEKRHQSRRPQHHSSPASDFAFVRNDEDATTDKKLSDDLQERRHQHRSNPASDFAFVRNNEDATTDKELSDDLQERRHQHRLNPASDFAFVRNNEDATTDKKLSDDLQERRHQHRSNPASDFAFVRNNEDATTDKKLSGNLQERRHQHRSNPASDFAFVRNVLVASGFHIHGGRNITRWHSSTQPISHRVLERLDFTGALHWRVLFDAVNEVLIARLEQATPPVQQCYGLPIIPPAAATGRRFVEDVWSEISKRRFHGEEEDFVAQDLKMSSNWMSLRRHVDCICEQLEKAIWNDLVHELLRTVK